MILRTALVVIVTLGLLPSLREVQAIETETANMARFDPICGEAMQRFGDNRKVELNAGPWMTLRRVA